VPQIPRISLEAPTPEKKREPLAAINRQIPSRPQELSLNTKMDYTMTDVPSRISSNRHSMAGTPGSLPSTLSQDPVPQEAAAVSVKRYSVPPALHVQTPTSAKRESLDESTPITVPKHRHEVKTVNLLKPVGSSENPAARKVSEEIGKINTNKNASKRLSMPNTPTYAVGKRSSVADIRQSLLAKAGSAASGAALPSSSVPTRDSSLRNSLTINHDTNKRFSNPISLNHVMASQPPTPLATTSSTSTAPFTARRDSSGGTTASRLAWIKSLEENAGKNPGRDMVFQKVQGSVAAKLAKFEQQNMPPPASVARSNSTVSRSSESYSIEAGSSFVGKRSSYAESPASTAATSNTVLTNFDEGFRAKMESLAGSLVDKATKDKENEMGPKGASMKLQEATNSKSTRLPKDVIDIINLSGTDAEVAINDFVGHGNLGRTRTLEDDLKRISIHDTPAAPAAQTTKPKPRLFTTPTMPTLDSLLNTPPSTPPPTVTTHSQSPTRSAGAASPTSTTSSPTRKTKAAGLSIVVGTSSATSSPVSPKRLIVDINSPPCAATFATLSTEALPLCKDELTPSGAPEELRTGSPVAESFNPAALPSFVEV
jgi:hypothetical protein